MQTVQILRAEGINERILRLVDNLLSRTIYFVLTINTKTTEIFT